MALTTQVVDIDSFRKRRGRSMRTDRGDLPVKSPAPALQIRPGTQTPSRPSLPPTTAKQNPVHSVSVSVSPPFSESTRPPYVLHTLLRSLSLPLSTPVARAVRGGRRARAATVRSGEGAEGEVEEEEGGERGRDGRGRAGREGGAVHVRGARAGRGGGGAGAGVVRPLPRRPRARGPEQEPHLQRKRPPCSFSVPCPFPHSSSGLSEPVRLTA